MRSNPISFRYESSNSFGLESPENKSEEAERFTKEIQQRKDEKKVKMKSCVTNIVLSTGDLLQ